MEWARISNFHDEFQGGGPAEGWTYAWDSTGKIGQASKYSPLLWSESAQVYNTTGGDTTVPGSKSHHDDYLQLGAEWGHPGQPKYMPLVGYTIQEEDGAGLYRLIESSIQKTNGITSSSEDGLGVLVYLNDTLIGSEASVSTDGSVASFDRELGQLSVGDTIWVAIDPLKTQYYDAFNNFDFSLEKLVPVTDGLAALSTTAVPEPSSLAVLLAAFSCGWLGWPRRARAFLDLS